MAINPERRLFLRGGAPPPIRPPWALPEEAFLARCTRCNGCLAGCPHHILVADRLGYPVADFTHGACTFCGECVRQCADQALVVQEGLPPWRHKPRFAKTCLNSRAIPCRTCGEQCGSHAILFPPTPGGRNLPELITERCNGCGACVGACPAQAIRVTT